MSPRLAAVVLFELPLYFYVIYLGTAVVAALVYGISGLTHLMGHLFGTHFDTEKSWRVTFLLWAGIGLATAVAYALGGANGA